MQMLQSDIDLRARFLDRVLHGCLQMRSLLRNGGLHLGVGVLRRCLHLGTDQLGQLHGQLVLELRDIGFQLLHEREQLMFEARGCLSSRRARFNLRFQVLQARHKCLPLGRGIRKGTGSWRDGRTLEGVKGNARLVRQIAGGGHECIVRGYCGWGAGVVG
jgi:hypothetical protein